MNTIVAVTFKEQHIKREDILIPKKSTKRHQNERSSG